MNTIHSALRSSRAAIDLASIMVGIIIIGLIGGVIAATVFAVIPWSQDKAAKQQLESIHTAENALHGLSSDSNVTLQGGAAKASFGNSTGLDANNFLSLSNIGAYCAIASPDGKDYHAYSKSGSGKWFVASNSNKSPQIVSGTVAPCITSGANAGTVDTTIDDGTKDLTTGSNSGNTGTSGNTGGSTTPTTPPAPVYTQLATYNFEGNYSTGKIGYPWYQSNAAYSEVRLEEIKVHSGNQGASAYAASSGTNVGIGFNQTVEVGSTYRITGWVKTDTSAKTIYVSNDNTGASSTPVNASTTWQQVSITTTATTTNLRTKFTATSNGGMPWLYLDDVTVEKVN
jgi:hypothetical protein